MNLYVRKYLAHLGSILFNLSILGLIAIIGLGFSGLFLILYYVVLIAIGILSLCTLFFTESYRDLFSIGENVNELLTKAMEYLPLVATICGICILCAFLCLLPDRYDKKSKTRLIASVLLLVVFIGVLIWVGGKNNG